jgi:hypothetical protein
MVINPLIKKLRIKPGLRMTIINPPAGYLDILGSLPDGVDFVQKLAGKFDFILVFVKNSQELEKFYPKATGVLKYNGIFWISYPKKSSGVKTDLSRDILWKIVENKGLRPVMAISIDNVWSALRFRPPELVNSKRDGRRILRREWI